MVRAPRLIGAIREQRKPKLQARRSVHQLACEACKGIDDNVLELTISQHKGTTEIGWRYSPKSSDKLI